MPRWVRLLISVFALAAVLAGGGTGGAFAAKTGHACAEMSVGDCPDGHCDNDATSPNCAQFVCGQLQIALPFLDVLISPAILTLMAPLPSRDDLLFSGLSGPPDLRPPIP
jgi:hypothetical protein